MSEILSPEEHALYMERLAGEFPASVRALRQHDEALRAENTRLRGAVKVREDQVGIWKTLLYRRIGHLEERLHHIEAVAGNVVLVDDEADLLVPDWRQVVEVLREAIDALRAALGDQAAPTEPTKAQRHVRHYQSCGCLDDSAECCNPECCAPQVAPTATVDVVVQTDDGPVVYEVNRAAPTESDVVWNEWVPGMPDPDPIPQAAPTEPPCDLCGNRGVILFESDDPEAPEWEPCPRGCAAPQVAPEPERWLRPGAPDGTTPHVRTGSCERFGCRPAPPEGEQG